MDLALAFRRPLGELMATMSSEEFSLWIARCKNKPLEDSYWQTGLIVAATQGGKPQDWMPYRKRKQSAKEMMRNLDLALNAANRRKK